MNSSDYDRLISLIYRSQTALPRWQETMRKASELLGFDGGKIVNVSPENVHVAASHGFYNNIGAIYTHHSDVDDIRITRYIERSSCGFVPHHTLCTDEELQETRIYKQFLRPNKLNGTIITVCKGDNGLITALIFDSRSRAGEIAPSKINTLNIIERHFRTSIKTVHENQEKLVDTVLSYMDAQGEAVATIDLSGNIRARNYAFHRLISKYTSNICELIDDNIIENDKNIQLMISRITTGDASPVLRPSLNEIHRLDYTNVRIIPAAQAPQDIFFVPFAYIHLSKEALERGQLERVNAMLFNLTATESEVAVALSLGESPAEIARRANVKLTTVRTHIRSIFRKTATHKRDDMTAKLYKGKK